MGIEELSTFRSLSIFPGPKAYKEPEPESEPMFKCTNPECEEKEKPVDHRTCFECAGECVPIED